MVSIVGECLGARVKTVQLSRSRANPQDPRFILTHCRDQVVAQAVQVVGIAPVDRERIPVIAVQSIPGTEPHKTLAILEDSTYTIAGKPIIRGMRIAVEHVLGMLAAGDTSERLLQEYPFLEPADIQACMAYAHRSLVGEQVQDRIAGARES